MSTRSASFGFGSDFPRRKADSGAESRQARAWFQRFLLQELKPYPGRWTVVLRMVLAAAVTMLVIMTFRIPGGANAVYNTLLVSRSSTQATLRTSIATVLWSAAAGLFSILGILLFIGNPLLHFLWVLAGIAVGFLAIKKLPVVSGAPFASTIMVILPMWDESAPASLLFQQSLWISGSVVIGMVVTVGFEYFFALFRTSDELTMGLVERLGAFRAFLQSCSDGQRKDQSPESRAIRDLAVLGISRLRSLISNPTGSQQEGARQSVVISLVGRLIDIGAAILDEDVEFDEADRRRLGFLGRDIAALQSALEHRGTPPLMPDEAPRLGGSALVFELREAVDMLHLALSPEWGHAGRQKPAPKPQNRANISSQGSGDAGTLSFVLRGTLAAAICYVVLNAVAWHGLSTSMVTCAITALSSVGSSRQKQVLRIVGAALGGILFGIGAQVVVVPALDTISGFTTLFVFVTFVAAWFATCSPRLSYLGLQIALAFYLVYVQDFAAQASLATGRDRVAGIGLGLLAMWLVFDTLGASSAVRLMTDAFAQNLDLLAEMADPWRNGQAADPGRFLALRERITQNFAQVNAQADAVLFETGPARQRNLAQRKRLLDLQPRLKAVFFVELALLRYRIPMQPQEVDGLILEAQQAFDQHAGLIFVECAQAIRAGKELQARETMGVYWKELEKRVRAAKRVQAQRADRLLFLFSRLAALIDGIR